MWCLAAGQLSIRPCPGGCHPTCKIARALAARHLVPKAFKRDAFAHSDLEAFVGRFGGPCASLLEVMICAAVSVMFFGFLRFDDLAGVGVHRDLLIITQSHMEIFVPRSKTDQTWKGTWVVVGRCGGPTCPVGLVERLLARGGYRRQPATPTEDVGPLLRAVQHTGAGGRLQQLVGTRQAPVHSSNYSTFNERVNAMCAEAGVTACITTHSLRIGGNSAAAEAGVPAELRQAHGRWLTPAMVDLYTRRTPAAGILITRRIARR